MEQNFKVVKYGRWLYSILDGKTNRFVKKPKYENSNFGYVDGEATFVTFKTKEKAQNYIDQNLKQNRR